MASKKPDFKNFSPLFKMYYKISEEQGFFKPVKSKEEYKMRKKLIADQKATEFWSGMLKKEQEVLQREREKMLKKVRPYDDRYDKKDDDPMRRFREGFKGKSKYSDEDKAMLDKVIDDYARGKR